MKIYIAGKITGLDIEQARNNFKEYQNEIESKGHEVVNPMELPHDHDKTWESYMKECLIAMLSCDAVCAMPNFNLSKGATMECELALSLNMGVFIGTGFIPLSQCPCNNIKGIKYHHEKSDET